MTTDFSALKFDHNHRKSSVARSALTGLRLVLLSLLIYSALIAVVIAAALNPGIAAYTESGVGGLIGLLLGIVAFGCGAYGTHLTMEALVFVIVVGLDLVSRNGYRITLFGPARKTRTPAAESGLP